MAQSVVTYTNKRIQTVMDSLGDFTMDNDQYCHIRKTDICELRALYGLSYVRGAQNSFLTDSHKLWSDSTFGHPIYGACLSRHRYSFLRQNVTFDDVTTRDMRWRTDRFAALRMFFQAAENFSMHMQPPEYLTIDETLYATRTDIAFRQYNPSKPARYGFCSSPSMQHRSRIHSFCCNSICGVPSRRTRTTLHQRHHSYCQINGGTVE